MNDRFPHAQRGPVLAGVKAKLSSPGTLVRRSAQRSASSSPHAAPGSPRSRRVCPPTVLNDAALPACGARKSPSWQVSHLSTTSGSNAATRPVSPEASSRA